LPCFWPPDANRQFPVRMTNRDGWA
jgi:hypothetical protein